jgi:hypothetical protein
MFIRRFIIWWSPLLLVAAARHLVAQLAVALAQDLALVHHQIAGDESFADAVIHQPSIGSALWLKKA